MRLWTLIALTTLVMEKVSVAENYSRKDKTWFRRGRSHVRQRKVRGNRRKSGSPGCDKRKLSNFSKLWHNAESRTLTLWLFLRTAIERKMKDEFETSKTWLTFSKISSLKIDIVFCENNKPCETSRKVLANVVIEYDSRLITAARRKTWGCQ